MTDPKVTPPPAPAPAAKEPLPGGSKGAYSATTLSVPPDEMLTEQEKDTKAGGSGVGPVSASEPSPGPVETMEDLGIGPREPYPSGGTPPARSVKSTPDKKEHK